MVLHKHVYGADTIFSTIAGPLANNPLVKWLEVIRRETHYSASEDIRWEYVPVSYLSTDIEPESDFSNYDSSD